MQALIDIEHAEASRFEDIASTLRKAVADPASFGAYAQNPLTRRICVRNKNDLYRAFF